MYKIKHIKPKSFDFDLIVIGTGSGGGVAAHTAAATGKKVAIVEDEKIGGECPNFGCIPTKTLLHAAEAYRAATASSRFGVHTHDVTFDYQAIQTRKDHVVHQAGIEAGEEFLTTKGIKVLHGHGHFINKWTVTVHGQRYTAKKFLIATGTKQVIPPIPGLAETGFLTYREAVNLTKPPKSLFVIGGGTVGCEFAELFNTFGTKVHVADMTHRLFANEDPEVGELLGTLFEQKGIAVHLGVKVTSVAKKGGWKIVQFEHHGKSQQVTVKEILLATGKAANTDLGLENASVTYDHNGIKTNAYMQTSASHIYAAGDVVGPYRFTHTASYQSQIAAHNMFRRENKKKADYHAVPRVVFLDPEVACVGLTEQQLTNKKMYYCSAAVPITAIDRANTSGVETGFVKILASKKGVILGASIVSPRAGEMIHELTLAIQHGMTVTDITDTIHAFPTWSEAVYKACQSLKNSKAK